LVGLWITCWLLISRRKDEQIYMTTEKQVFYNDTIEDDDWMKSLPGYQGELAIHAKLAKSSKAQEGGTGSGNFGHAGRPGIQGGSAPSSGVKAANPSTKDHFYGGKFTPASTPKVQYKGEILIKQKSGFGVSTDTKKIEAMREEISFALSRHPDWVADKIEVITICTSSETWKDECRRSRLDPETTAAFFSVNFDEIVIPVRGSASLNSGLAKNYFDHEVGHAVWKNLSSTIHWSYKYLNDQKFDRHTAYANSGGPEESFCETYASWVSRGMTGNWKSFKVVEEVINKGHK